jgi:hypothetical protein
MDSGQTFQEFVFDAVHKGTRVSSFVVLMKRIGRLSQKWAKTHRTGRPQKITEFMDWVFNTVFQYLGEPGFLFGAIGMGVLGVLGLDNLVFTQAPDWTTFSYDTITAGMNILTELRRPDIMEIGQIEWETTQSTHGMFYNMIQGGASIPSYQFDTTTTTQSNLFMKETLDLLDNVVTKTRGFSRNTDSKHITKHDNSEISYMDFTTQKCEEISNIKEIKDMFFGLTNKPAPLIVKHNGTIYVCTKIYEGGSHYFCLYTRNFRIQDAQIMDANQMKFLIPKLLDMGPLFRYSGCNFQPITQDQEKW